MKRHLLIFSLLIVSLSLSAQSVLSFGARGGLEFMMPKSDQTVHSKTGYAGVLDIGFTNYWLTTSGYWGINTGVSAGYAKNECQIDLRQQQYMTDLDNWNLLVVIDGDMSTKLQRTYVEIPLMAAFRSHGFVMQLGVKGQYAFWSKTTQNFNGDPTSEAVLLDVGVTFENYIEFPKKEMSFTGNAPSFSILAATRIGYEAKIKNFGRIGIIAYLDYNIWNTGTGTSNSSTPLISITPPSATESMGLEINDAFSAVITRINPLQVGLSLYYAIEFMPRDKYYDSVLY